jgi:hypothetical protein
MKFVVVNRVCDSYQCGMIACDLNLTRAAFISNTHIRTILSFPLDFKPWLPLLDTSRAEFCLEAERAYGVCVGVVHYACSRFGVYRAPWTLAKSQHVQ